MITKELIIPAEPPPTGDYEMIEVFKIILSKRLPFLNLNEYLLTIKKTKKVIK